jgi:acetylornithine aminotransferase
LEEAESFAHQFHNIKPDIICMAKEMGNGFPIGGILIAPHFKASFGFWNYFWVESLACAASMQFSM